MAYSLHNLSVLTFCLYLTIIRAEHIKLSGFNGEHFDIRRRKNLSCLICENGPSTAMQETIRRQETTIRNLETRVGALEQLLQGLLANEMNMVVELLSSLPTSNEKPTAKTTTTTTETIAQGTTPTQHPQQLVFVEGPTDMCGGLRSFHRLQGISPKTNETTWSKKCYYFGKTKTFRHASNACKRKTNARLAEFPDMEEYEIVKTYLESNKPGERFWIGGQARKENHEQFIWSTSHNPISDRTWVPTEPTYTYRGMEETCMSFDGRGRYLNDGGVISGGWKRYDNGDTFRGYGLNDEFCVGQSLRFTCQI